MSTPIKRLRPKVMTSLPIMSIPSPSVPVFTQKERDNYVRQKDKAKFKSPEEEYGWSSKEIKRCTVCKEEKPLSSYNGNTSGTDAFDKTGYRLRRPECNECTKEAGKGKAEAKKLAKSMGIPYEAPEGTKCRICEKEATKGNGLVFDHCHEKNIFRGYLCNSCNRSMGVLGDNVEGLLKALNYLLISEPKKIVQSDDGGLALV
jgi:hypothetical protein